MRFCKFFTPLACVYLRLSELAIEKKEEIFYGFIFLLLSIKIDLVKKLLLNLCVKTLMRRGGIIVVAKLSTYIDVTLYVRHNICLQASLHGYE